MSSRLVRGLTMQNRSTVSPSCLVGVTSPSPRSSSVTPLLILFRCPADAAKDANRQALLGDHFQVWVCLDHGRCLASAVQRDLNRVGVGFCSVYSKAKPEGQAARATRQMVRVVAGVPDAVVKYLEVVTVLAVRFACLCWVGIDECATVKGREQPFVRVHDKAVCALNAVEKRPGRGRRQPAPRMRRPRGTTTSLWRRFRRYPACHR